MKVALMPMTLTWGDKDANMAALREQIKNLHAETELLILPETFTTGFPAIGTSKEELRQLAERNSGPTMQEIRRLAAENNMAICGSFIADSGGSIYNRAFFVEPGGEDYFADKRHLFTMAGENKTFSRGYDRLSVRYRGWNIAMVVCYDVRFPVWCRNDRRHPYDLLIAVANWPKVRVNAWNQLLPARAIENLSYLCAVNCKGVDTKDFEYDGSSMAIDFKGKSIGIADPMGGDVIYANLSLEKLNAFREKFPAHRDADFFSIDVHGEESL